MPEPKLVEKNEMKIVGCVSFGGDIGELWDVFMRLEKAVSRAKPGVGYEIHIFPEHASKCHVMVGVEVESLENQPLEMFGKILPPTMYAVFTHRLANGGYTGANEAMDAWLKESEYRQAVPMSIQVYDERFKMGNQPDSEIDFYIPIVKK